MASPAVRKVWLHRGLAGVWALLAIPGVLWWAESILFVIAASVYANIASEWSTSEASDDRLLVERLDRIETTLSTRRRWRPTWSEDRPRRLAKGRATPRCC
jgi:hypothetical protein